jgi:rRNA biogenesis protein RRP5
MKILGQIVSIQPLALIVSLPNQLFAHVPITNISSQLTALLEEIEQEDEESEEDSDEGEPRKSPVPTLFEIFREGQYLRAVVSVVHAHGSTDISGVLKSRDEVVRASRRVELSLLPEKVNSGVQKSDLSAGFASAVFQQSMSFC